MVVFFLSLKLSQKELFLISLILHTILVSKGILFLPSCLSLELGCINNNLVVEQVEARLYFWNNFEVLQLDNCWEQWLLFATFLPFFSWLQSASFNSLLSCFFKRQAYAVPSNYRCIIRICSKLWHQFVWIYEGKTLVRILLHRLSMPNNEA